MQQKPRWFVGLLVFCVAQAMLVFGLATALEVFVFDAPPGTAPALIAGGLLLAMIGVIDPLVPEATRLFTGTIKVAVLGVLLVCAALTLYSVITGRNEPPWLS